MEDNGYVTQQLAKIYDFAKQGNTGPELIPLLDNIKEIIIKQEEVKKKLNDPVRTESMEFGTPEEDNNKGPKVI